MVADTVAAGEPCRVLQQRDLRTVIVECDDLTVDAAGRVQLSNKIYAERDVQISAAGVEVSGAAPALLIILS